MKTRSKWEAAYYFGFMMRRVIYVAIALVVFTQDYQHILAMFYLNLAWIIYLGSSWPHQRKTISKIDMANEFIIVAIFLHLFTFTDFVPDLELQYSIGWSMNGFVVLLICLNMYFVFWHGGRQIFLILKKYKNRISHWSKKPEPEEEPRHKKWIPHDKKWRG